MKEYELFTEETPKPITRISGFEYLLVFIASFFGTILGIITIYVLNNPELLRQIFS